MLRGCEAQRQETTVCPVRNHVYNSIQLYWFVASNLPGYIATGMILVIH